MQHALAPAPHHPVQHPTQVKQDNDSELRDQLLTFATSPQQSSANTMDHHLRPPSSSASPNESTNIDPTMANSANQMQAGSIDSADEADGSARRGAGKRELSTSKRAAQNRAAQRAFRQRKEGYIKKLEEKVKDSQAIEENFKQIQAENYQLREYIINLQSRLIESQTDVPEPPSNIDFSNKPRALASEALAAASQVFAANSAEAPSSPIAPSSSTLDVYSADPHILDKKGQRSQCKKEMTLYSDTAPS
ncbi:MAG: hypothetical protein M1814_003386 [Vezdaea aestivalis]|nr:MAG: hypothetical protein M1814_003386 [Vezdaea aestivalis]